jgi:hypothetical protein
MLTREMREAEQAFRQTYPALENTSTVVELSLHRGAFEPQLADEDQEIDFGSPSH